MRILCIIPARGGSKGIPHKNIVDVNGKPLIYYTIKPALEVKKRGYIDEVIVSTEDETIARIARELGVNVPFMRPVELAGDKSKSIDCVLHALAYFEEKGEKYDAVLLLQITSPLRTAENIIEAIELFKMRENISLVSCYKEESVSIFNSYEIDNEGYGIPKNNNHNKGIRRQDIPSMYVRNGAIYITKTNYLKTDRLIISEKPLLYIMPIEQSINIDTVADLSYARWLIKENG